MTGYALLSAFLSLIGAVLMLKFLTTKSADNKAATTVMMATCMIAMLAMSVSVFVILHHHNIPFPQFYGDEG